MTLEPCSPCCALCARGETDQVPSRSDVDTAIVEDCVCRCGRRAQQLHHVIYQQHIRTANWTGHPAHKPGLRDRRNLVAVNRDCHAAHHQGSKRLPLHALPDSVFEFAAELFGAPAAYEYLARFYVGPDDRLGELLEVAA